MIWDVVPVAYIIYSQYKIRNFNVYEVAEILFKFFFHEIAFLTELWQKGEDISGCDWWILDQRPDLERLLNSTITFEQLSVIWKQIHCLKLPEVDRRWKFLLLSLKCVDKKCNLQETNPKFHVSKLVMSKPKNFCWWNIKQDCELFPETILVYHKIMKHPTFDPKVCIKLNFVRWEPEKLQTFTFSFFTNEMKNFFEMSLHFIDCYMFEIICPNL